MKPQYRTLKANHYSSNSLSENYKDAGELYEEVGYKFEDLSAQNRAYENTCAARMSLALIKSGVNFAGRLKVKKSPYIGRAIEPGAKLLADQLSRSTVFGKPKIMAPEKAIKSLFGKRGVIFFWKITGYNGGHIDLVETANSAHLCHSHCYFACKEVWFWELL